MTEIIRLAPGENLSDNVLQKTAKAAAGCKLVVFPTDTVYGLGSTALVKAAARRIYQVKERSSLKPLPIFFHSISEVGRWAQWTASAEALAKKFWPGPLTLVLRPTAEGRLLTFAEYPTIAVRVPAHPVVLSMLKASGVPWVATSANISGRPALTDGEAAVKQFNGLADIIIAQGAVAGIESTLVDASSAPVRVLREGAISRAQIEEAVSAAA